MNSQMALNSRAFLIFGIILSCFSLCWCAASEKVQVTVRGGTSIAKTDESFVCVTMDWWPSDKCNYGSCPWVDVGLFNLDFRNERLFNAVKAFKNLRVRIGGSLEDQIVYGVGKAVKNCQKMVADPNGLFGFSEGCLTMSKWDEINKFLNETKSITTFGLNALFGRVKLNGEDNYAGDWNPINARDFIDYTVSKGYKIDSYEFGNELCAGGVSGKVDAVQYAKDMQVLKQLVIELYPNSWHRPKVMGPAGFYDEKWFNTFLQASGPNVVDGLSHHIYNLGAGVDPKLIDRVQDPYYLAKVAQTYKDVANTINLFGPWAEAWVGESGGAYNSGGKNVSGTFVDGFWYLDQLGMTSTFNHKVFCRQALVGGHYSLLNLTTFAPNPDYYGALLWHRLMGSKVLSVTHNQSPFLKTYAHCSRTKPGVTLFFINMDNSTAYDVSLVNDLNLIPGPGDVLPQFAGAEDREEYHLTALNGNIQSEVMLLNGTPLKLNSDNDIPEMGPKLVKASEPLTIAPQSMVFVTVRDIHAPAC